MTLDENKLDETATHIAPYILSIARVVIALMFMEHGTSKLFGFPAPTSTPDPFTLLWFAAIIEIVGGAMLALGLWTRLAAFIMSGEMAIGYFMSHAPHGFFPIANRGDAAALYCLIFLYFAFAGGGPWTIATLFGKRMKEEPRWHSARAAR
ncbi:MAG: DoxX family protein [Pseudolabrys sp.]